MPLKHRKSEAIVPKRRIYHYVMTLRLKREEELAIKAYAKRHKLGVAEAVRELIAKALEQDKR